jgi:thiol:disulfide interchange protein
MTVTNRLRDAVLTLLMIALAACSPPVGGPARTASPAATSMPAAAGSSLYDEAADARADIAAALALAKADGKRVLLDFGADWCPDCHVLSAYMDGPAGRQVVEPAFHVVRIDVGYWDHNIDVANQYANPIAAGIPAVVVLEPDGTMVGSSAEGTLANARGMSERQVLDYLSRWVR